VYNRFVLPLERKQREAAAAREARRGETADGDANTAAAAAASDPRGPCRFCVAEESELRERVAAAEATTGRHVPPLWGKHVGWIRSRDRWMVQHVAEAPEPPDGSPRDDSVGAWTAAEYVWR
jgi:hypothetical protein